MWMSYIYLGILCISCWGHNHITLQRRHGILQERGNDYPQRRSNILLGCLIVAFFFFDLWVAWDGADAHNPAWQVQHAGIPETGEIVQSVAAADPSPPHRPPADYCFYTPAPLAGMTGVSQDTGWMGKCFLIAPIHPHPIR